MEILALPGQGPAVLPGAVCVALGFFDGVHMGHRAVLSQAAARARALSIPLLVYTFRGDDAPKGGAPLLSDDRERCALFHEAGAELCVLADFSEVRATDPAEFVRELLLGRLHAAVAVVGEDFRFGFRAAGDADLLLRLMRAGGGDALILPPVQQGGAPISSSRIRAALGRGDCAGASAMLGRPYAITAPVVRGEARGRDMGLPTANQQPGGERLLPADGVYVTDCVTEDGRILRGVTDVGLRPTVSGDERRIETHILDFSGDLYGRPLTVRFLARLRDEVAFPTLSALTAQIQKDKEEARAWKPQNGQS